jgi:hypothetical protein
MDVLKIILYKVLFINNNRVNIIINMNIININSINYYKALELKKYDPAYFVGCAQTIRKIIKRKSIPDEDYIYGNISKKNGWTVVVDKSNPNTKAVLLLREEWVVNNIPYMMEDEELAQDNYDYPPAPEELILNDNEKFRDNEGRTIEIETIGIRTPKGVYFKASDVSKEFNMPNLSITVLNKDNGYDTCIFIKQINIENITTLCKILYITYRGMLRILYSNNIKQADEFVEWSSNIVFTQPLQYEITKLNRMDQLIKSKDIIINNKDVIIENKNLIIENMKKDIEIEKMKNIILKNNLNI